jgi:hypothetical protein
VRHTTHSTNQLSRRLTSDPEQSARCISAANNPINLIHLAAIFCSLVYCFSLPLPVICWRLIDLFSFTGLLSIQSTDTVPSSVSGSEVPVARRPALNGSTCKSVGRLCFNETGTNRSAARGLYSSELRNIGPLELGTSLPL